MVLEHLSALQIGILYGAVGIGLLITGFVVPLLVQTGDWTDLWKGLGLLSFILSMFAWYLLQGTNRDRLTVKATAAATIRPANVQRILIFLIIAYGLEGLGYIVTGTYLVAYAKEVTGILSISSLSWVLVGLAAAPSCVIWSIFASKRGYKLTLIMAMIIQAIGIAIPILIPSLAAILIGSFFIRSHIHGDNDTCCCLCQTVGSTEQP